MIAQNEAYLQGKLGNETDNRTVLYKHRTGRRLISTSQIMVTVRLFHIRQ